MRPTDLGLPGKFADFRKGQYDAVIDAAASDKRFTLLSIPTGGGKSVTYTSVAKMLDTRALVLTGTKGLQQQLTYDFSPIGMFDIRGQNNYRCIAYDPGYIFDTYGVPGTTCDQGPCHLGIQCNLREHGCAYYDAVRTAANSPLVVTNYMYWMTSNRYSDPEALGNFGLLILDEAHDAPFYLADFCTIELERDEVRQLLDLSLPPIDEGQEVWAEWADTAYSTCREFWLETRNQLIEVGADRRRLSRLLRRLTDLSRKLKELAKAHQWRNTNPSNPEVWMPGAYTDWIAEPIERGLRFSPVWAHAYAEEYLFKGIPKIILTSATLQPATARYLGIPDQDMEFREYASTFDPKRRPFIYLPTTTVDRNMTEGQVRIWINKIDRIIDQRLHLKGIVHTRSYDRAKIILERSRHKAHMLSHTGRTARDVVDRFKRATAPAILVSPSMETGWDFPHDQCRYQILTKVPFVDTRSAIVQARAKSDRSYLNYLTALSIIQQVGRGMRAENDWCETFIIDDHISWFWQAAKKQKLFPRWFQAAYRREVGVPPPMKVA